MVLPHPSISSTHCTLRIEGDEVVVEDQGSSNGTFLDGRQVTSARLGEGQGIVLADVVVLRVDAIYEEVSTGGARTADPAQGERTVYVGGRIFVDPAAAEAADDGDEGPPLASFRSPVVSVAQLSGENAVVEECRYLAAGGGIGSFVWVDHLRVFGVAREHIRVVGDNPVPYGNYQRYCRNSQIPPHERLRSNSLSAPDNIWGFPGYATREAWKGVRNGRLGDVGHMFTVFSEPALAISYTPRAQDVFDSMDKEATRIGWREMFTRGRVRALRKTDDGRYALLYRRSDDHGARYGVILARFVHLATGYPAVRFLDDLQSLKARRPHLGARVVNAYDPHDHVYADIARGERTMVVAVRGRGIVASRILQRLNEMRVHNGKLQVIHLLRSKRAYGTGSRFGRTKRPVFNDVELQPFNWPKACWGGSLRERIEAMPEAQRAQTYGVLGGTTTAEREDWTQIVNDGLRDGWYVKYYGKVERIDQSKRDADRLSCAIAVSGEVSEQREFECDYVIDCTGLIANMEKSPFLRDLLSTYSLPRNNGAPPGRPPNPLGFLVSNTFEVEGLRNSGGRVYASGQLVGGGPYAAVDSFLGLQYCALRSVQELAATPRSGVRNLGPLASLGQWSRWVRGVAP